jgi:hypothetical protein
LWILAGDNYLGMGICRSKLWQTERRIGWTVESVQSAGESDDKGFERTIISGTVCETDPDVESGKVDPRVGGWWRKTPYTLELTGAGVFLTRKEIGPNTRYCVLP